ncbi:MAG: hypothetical protein ABGZ19_09130 [Verrucomicrobiales bacterium]
MSAEIKNAFSVYYLKIRYWFVPENHVMDKIVKVKTREKSAKEAKAKKELEDL